MSRLLALDQASKTTGYAVFVDGNLEAFGKFSFDHQDIDIRLVLIRQKVQELIVQYNIEEVIYEDIQQQNNVQNNVQTFKVLAEVYGVISEVLTSIDIRHSSVLSTSWKSSLSIKGRNRVEQKRNAQKYVNEKYGITATQDECDAICIGEYKIKQSVNDWSN